MKPFLYALSAITFLPLLPASAQTDWGDATDSTLVARYPTLSAHNGARHTATGPRLGSLRDAESNGLPNSTATGDDAAPAGSDDEDGVEIGDLVRADGQRLRITVQGGSGFLNAWVDWNADHDWLDAGERVFTNLPVAAGASSPLLNVPAHASEGTTFARFRLTQASVTNPLPTGLLPSGEVEDYLVTVKSATDLRLALTATQTVVALNQTTTFTLTVTNSGPVAATGISVAFALPAGLTAQGAATASTGTYNGSVWTLGSLNSTVGSNNATLTVPARAAASGTPLAYAQITAASPPDTDATAGDNSGRGQAGDPAHADDDASLTMALGNAAPPQDVSGKVWYDFDGDGVIDAGESGLEASVQLRFAGSNGLLNDADDVTATAATNASGDFLFEDRTPGIYQVTLAEAVAGFQTVTLDPAPFTVGSAAVTGRNIGRRGSRNFGGKVVDIASRAIKFDEIPLPGLTLSLTWSGPDGDLATTADNRSFPPAVTGADGGYLFTQLPPGLARLDLSQAGLPAGLRLISDPDGAETPFTALVDLSFSAGGGDFFFASRTSVEGFVFFDSDGNGLSGDGEERPIALPAVQASLVRTSDGVVVQTQQVSGANDGHLLLEGAPPGSYRVRISGLPAGFFFSPLAADTADQRGNDIAANGESAPFTLAVAGESAIDAGISTTGFSGIVSHDEDGNGLLGFAERSRLTIHGGTVQLFREGGASAGPAQSLSGEFLFPGLTPGTYFVKFVLPSGLFFSAANQGTVEAEDSDVLAGGVTAVLTVGQGQFITSLCDMLFTGGGLAGQVWHDANANSRADDFPPGIGEFGEVAGLAGVTVAVISQTTLQEAAPAQVTGADGQYGFFGLPAGSYFLRVTGLPPGFVFSPEAFSQTVNEFGVSQSIDLAAGELKAGLDAGAFDPAGIFLRIETVSLAANGDLVIGVRFTSRLEFEVEASVDLQTWGKTRITLVSGDSFSGEAELQVQGPIVPVARLFLRLARSEGAP